MRHLKTMLIAAALLAPGVTAIARAPKAPAAPAMSPEVKLAESLWKLRAALNVGALQCQFDPTLKTVSNFNDLQRMHRDELNDSRATMEGYYRRAYGRAGLAAFDKYNTKLWNTFSTVNAQVPFCRKVSEVGGEALTTQVGALTILANNRLPEIIAVFPKPAPPAVSTARKPVAKKTSRKKRRK